MLQIYAGSSANQLLPIDLDKETEFDIEIEQPILSEDSMPVPFSTSIDIPVTDNNRLIFDYLPFLALEPGNKELHARICVDGITLTMGMLTFDGIRDGRLQYTFNGQDLSKSEAWKRKIWDISAAHIAALPNDYVEFPVMLNADATGKQWHPVIPTGSQGSGTGGTRTSSPSAKYRNYNSLWLSRGNAETPAIRMDAILMEALSGVAIPTPLSGLWNRVAVIGNFPTYNLSGDPGRNIRNSFSNDAVSDAVRWFGSLPDLTVAEFVREALKLRGGAVFYDGSSIRIMTADSMLSANPVDWTEKISDVFSLTSVGKQALLMGYTDLEQAKEPENPHIQEFESLAEILDAAAESDSNEYQNYRHAILRDVYSMKPTNDKEKELGDIVCQTLNAEEPPTEVEDSLDLRTILTPVKCIPDRLYTKEDTWVDRIVPVVKVAAPTDERGKTVLIGILKEGQICDKGMVIDDGEDTGITDSLDIQTLYANVPELDGWLASQRRRVEADLNLSLKDIADLRMWQKFYFMGSTWIAEKFTIHLTANGHKPTVTGSFISCPF